MTALVTPAATMHNAASSAHNWEEPGSPEPPVGAASSAALWVLETLAVEAVADGESEPASEAESDADAEAGAVEAEALADAEAETAGAFAADVVAPAPDPPPPFEPAPAPPGVHVREAELFAEFVSGSDTTRPVWSWK